MSTTKWIPGVTKLMHIVHGEDLFTGEIPREDCEREGWRAVDTSSVGGGRKLTAGWLQCTTPGAQCSTDGCVRRVTLRMGDRRFCSACGEERGAVDPPVDAPAEKRERELAPGWRRATAGKRCTQDGCAGRAEFTQASAAFYSMCTACAEAAGAFATPAPAKTGCADCGVEWCGQNMERMHPSGESYSMVDTESPGPRYGSGACLRRALANGTARAKPAEPKPAPAEKAKPVPVASSTEQCIGCDRRVPSVAERWMMFQGSMRNVDACDACYLIVEECQGKTRDHDDGDRGALFAALARENPPAINVRGVRSIYLPPTESQGERLSRLVESGLRADVRQDETRFQAGLRGWR